MQNEDSKKVKNVFYVTHSVEFLFWLVILFIIVAFYTFHNIKLQKIDNDYNIFMQDIDGLIVGSPVRMMGIEVGYITEIKPTNSEVFVKFVINDKNIIIPQGTEATVEFSGLAGSKSLELYLPDKDKKVSQNSDVIVVAPPKRLHDALGLLNDMFDKLGSIILTTSSFGDKLNTIDLPVSKEKDFKNLIKYSDKMLNETNNKINEFDVKIQKISKKLKELN